MDASFEAVDAWNRRRDGACFGGTNTTNRTYRTYPLRGFGNSTLPNWQPGGLNRSLAVFRYGQNSRLRS